MFGNRRFLWRDFRNQSRSLRANSRSVKFGRMVGEAFGHVFNNHFATCMDWQVHEHNSLMELILCCLTHSLINWFHLIVNCLPRLLFSYLLIHLLIHRLCLLACVSPLCLICFRNLSPLLWSLKALKIVRI